MGGGSEAWGVRSALGKLWPFWITVKRSSYCFILSLGRLTTLTCECVCVCVCVCDHMCETGYQTISRGSQVTRCSITFSLGVLLSNHRDAEGREGVH